MWVPATELAKAPGHPFYQRLNRVLGKHGFDDFVEAECTAFYASSRGRPGLAEEQPAAYKDVDEVVNCVSDAGLSRKVARLCPMGVIKG